MSSVAIGALGRPRVRRVLAECVLVAVVALVIAVRILASVEPGARTPGFLAYALGGLIAALLPARRRAPLAVLLASVGLLIVYHALDYPGFSPAIPLAVPLYAVAVAGRLGWAVGAAVVSIAGAGLFPVLQDHVAVTAAASQLTPQAALLGALVLLGEAVRSRRALAAEAARAARHAVLDREREADRLVTEERLRIARELHDVLAHTLAGAAIQASVAADTLTDDPPTSREAIDAVRASFREARTELAATVGVLRDNGRGNGSMPADRAPVPGLAQLNTLLDMGRRAGLRVDVVVGGEPRELPPAVDMTAYRIVQESLTNVVEHAAARSVVVSLAHRPAEIIVSVTDDGHGDNGYGDSGRGAGSPSAEGGFGLMGMRERASAVGGRLRAGNRPEGGYQVVATLPATVEARAGQ
jgi:signal transduction histidine kinase